MQKLCFLEYLKQMRLLWSFRIQNAMGFCLVEPQKTNRLLCGFRSRYIEIDPEFLLRRLYRQRKKLRLDESIRKALIL